ncbi:MAG: hypothetical protein PHV11_03210, partial [Candidatus Bipolaricaulis sp.]|nr:hypothetical protein [Candidatus Bipolaricaulis sp.]
AQADAFAAAQACATAAAAAQASATAAAEAAVRAEVSAQACAEALTQAMAMANAAAEASASAQTSVEVVPDIETSVRAIIDPECLTPVCEQAGRPLQCPPCNSCCEETPGTTTTGECPEPKNLTWTFGDVPTGMRYTATKSIPADVITHLSQFTIVSSYETYSSLPPDGSFTLDLTRRTGTASGTFTAGVSYRVILEFVDSRKCPVGTLTVLIGTGPSQGSTETQQACMNISAVFEQQQTGLLALFSRGGMTELAVPVVVNSSETRTTAFQLCGTLRQQFLLVASKDAYTPQQVRLAFNRWEQKSPGSDSWGVASEQPSLSGYLVSGMSYRAVYVPITVGTTTPGTTTPGTTTPTPAQQPCLNVSAVFVYETIGSTSAYPPATRRVEEPLGVVIIINGRDRRTTDFQVCGSAGVRLTLQASAEAYSQSKERLAFSFWERYNTQTGSWEAISEEATLAIALQQGGQIRAVYYRSTALY